MLQEIEQLLVLQDRDRKIRALRQELNVAPQQRRGLEDRLAETQRQYDASKLHGKEIEVERKRLEIEAEAKRGQIAKLQTQKFQTRKNEEFAAFSHEIDRYEDDVRRLEDRELELMEEAEKQRGIVAVEERNLGATKTQVEKQSADLDAKIKTIEANLAALEAERTKLAASVDEDLADTYQRLFQNKNGEAIVSLDHGVCMGCHTKVTPTTSALCRAGKEVVQCENCARILYRGED
ncbi:MAG: C4-type zinc ribbon domain-containing protein [Chthoniobacteraceae bacterium]